MCWILGTTLNVDSCVTRLIIIFFRSYAGPSRGADGSRTSGSPFVQTFMKHMLQDYKRRNLKDIFLDVKNDMSKQRHKDKNEKVIDLFT